jgi:hypothetical protein
MLSVYLKKPLTREQYDSSPAGPHLEAFLLWLEERGYPPRRIRHLLRGVHDFAQGAQDAGLPIQAFEPCARREPELWYPGVSAFCRHLYAPAGGVPAVPWGPAAPCLCGDDRP